MQHGARRAPRALVAPTVRAFFGDGRHLADAKAAQSYVGLAPSNWSSGTAAQPSRAITTEGPEELRLAFYLAANAARMVDPQLADFYRKLMVERRHCHTSPPAEDACTAKGLANLAASHDCKTGRPFTVIHHGHGATALLGMCGFVVGAQLVVHGELWLYVETTADQVGCDSCGPGG